MIKEQKITIKWRTNTKNHFLSKGYIFSKMHEEFEVDVFDLPKGTSLKVEFICDFCNGINQTEDKYKFRKFINLMNNKESNKKDYCKLCAAKLNGKQFQSGESLAEKFPSIAKEWNYNKNEGNPSEYGSGSGKRVWWICEKGHEWYTTIGNRTSGKTNCPYCGNRKVCNDNSLATLNPRIASEWHPIKNGDLSANDVMQFSKKEVWWIGECGHEWKTKVAIRTRINAQAGCPICMESKGEKRIREVLEIYGIVPKQQFKFDDLRGMSNSMLKFDFAILINNKVVLLIEYDGEFHFGEVYDGDNHYRTIEHDERKNIYCKKYNIPLLRIPHWDFDNIEEILHKELTKYKLLTSD